MKNAFLILMGILIMITFNNCGNENILENLIDDNLHELNPVIDNKDKYELQIIYTQIIRDNENNVKFNTYSFNGKPDTYFYPASTVKFAAAVLALEKLNDLNIEGVNKYTHLSIDSVYGGHVSFDKNFKDECGYPNIANYIKQIFIVSDNEAFNRLYDFLGQKEINEKLLKRGFNNTKIIHRLSVARSPKQNRETNPIKFYNNEGNIIFEQPARIESTDVQLELKNTLKGVGYIANGELINKPKDFSANNFFSLRDQHELLLRIFFPKQFDESQKFYLTDDDYNFLRKYMSMLPKESECPKYDTDKYYDSYVKFLMFGDSEETIPDNIKIYSKSGLAYGYLTDNAYIVDEKNGVEFILSATVHVNENQIYNDDNYEYDEIGLPFLAKLGKVIYEFELNNN